MMSQQPVPSVNDDDVRRIALRDFGKERLSDVLSLLGEFGKQPWNTPSARVSLAILKLANGDIDRLREALDIAMRDYRDVLAAAEYPTYHREIGFDDVDEDKRRNVIDADWAEYREWFGSKSI
jgi:hypothetical protein